MTPLLRRLEGKGLVERGVPPGDERQRRIRLTPRGADLAAAGNHAAAQAYCATGLDPEEARALQQQCLRLVAHLDLGAQDPT